MGAVTEQAWFADRKVMVHAVIGCAHACSVGPRYLKCLRPKKERWGIRRVVEQLQKSDLHVRESSSMKAKKEEEEEEEKL